MTDRTPPDVGNAVAVMVVVGLCTVILFSVISWIAGRETGYLDAREVFKKEAVENGHAQYDSLTGEWKWIETQK